MKEPLKLALEALEMFCEHGAILRPIETRDAIKAVLAQPEQEPVVFNTLTSLKHKTTVGPIESAMMNITPPQRTWVGLTDEEIWTVLQFRGYNTDTIEIAKAIEAKLKEKNQ